MSEANTWQAKQAASPNPYAVGAAAWHAHADLDDAERMQEAVEAYDAALVIAQQCDEPGCALEAGCGFPVEGGYRRTCFEHSVFSKARP